MRIVARKCPLPAPACFRNPQSRWIESIVQCSVPFALRLDRRAHCCPKAARTASCSIAGDLRQRIPKEIRPLLRLGRHVGFTISPTRSLRPLSFACRTVWLPPPCSAVACPCMHLPTCLSGPSSQKFALQSDVPRCPLFADLPVRSGRARRLLCRRMFLGVRPPPFADRPVASCASRSAGGCLPVSRTVGPSSRIQSAVGWFGGLRSVPSDRLRPA